MILASLHLISYHDGELYLHHETLLVVLAFFLAGIIGAR